WLSFILLSSSSPPPCPPCAGRPGLSSRSEDVDGRDEPGHDGNSYFALSPTTRTRCWTLRIMPRVAGVSGKSLTRPILLRPSPISVARWSKWRRIGLPTCSTLMVFPAAMRHLLFGRGFRLGAFAPARLQGRYFDVAPRRDRARGILRLERIEGRSHHVVGIGRADRLGNDIRHAERLKYRPHWPARDDAGPGRRR